MLDELLAVRQAGGEVGGVRLARLPIDAPPLHRGRRRRPKLGERRSCGVTTSAAPWRKPVEQPRRATSPSQTITSAVAADGPAGQFGRKLDQHGVETGGVEGRLPAPHHHLEGRRGRHRQGRLHRLGNASGTRMRRGSKLRQAAGLRCDKGPIGALRVVLSG
ncbi:MAG: hypothetical protein IPP50_02235 [Piscinibacter sp.]|nr:hypothetical protein [Piscinibacter sp.]